MTQIPLFKRNAAILVGAACALTASAWLSTAQAQDRVFRCGNEYTNNVRDAQARGCKPVEGGNVTIIQGSAAPKPVARVGSAQASSPTTPRPMTDSAEQRARDAQARTILEAELAKSEARLAGLMAEYKNGEPDKQGIEGRNYQRYLDRVAEMKDSIARTQSDIAGLKREIARLPSVTSGLQ